MKSTIRIVTLATLLLTSKAYGQYYGPVAFLTYPDSPRSLGMGGVGTAIVTDNAAGTIDNPAQLGMLSLDGPILCFNRDMPNSLGSAGFEQNNSFDASAVNFGFVANRIWRDLPFKLGVGLGYSNVANSYYPISLTQNPSLVNGRETDVANAVSIGVAGEDFVRFGVGYTLKWLDSRYDLVKQSAQDFGVIIQIPIIRFARRSKDDNNLPSNYIRPTAHLNLGYAIRNVGGYMQFGALLPLQASLGWDVDLGLTSRVAGRQWKWLSISWSDEALDIPVRLDSTIGIIYNYDTLWNYQLRYRKGLGNINPWHSLILGKGSATVGVRRGGQIGLGEFLFIRAGSITDASETTYSTFGWGLHIDGLVKCLLYVKWLNPNAPFAEFLLHHLDLQYDYSRAYGGIYQGKPFEDLNLVLR